MNTHIKKIGDWLGRHPHMREWCWFVALWLGGLLTALSMAYPLKWIIREFM